jgi:microcystin-dependent protein
MDPLIGTIILFAGNFAPRGWMFCNGQILSISTNTALFAILGNTYGGNGQTTFALPDLRGRVPMSAGQGTGLSMYVLGEQSGVETVSLLVSEMPMHTHMLAAANVSGTTDDPTNNLLAKPVDSDLNSVNAYASVASSTIMNPVAINAAGGSQPHSNLQPYLALNYIIAVEGIFPTRN